MENTITVLPDTKELEAQVDVVIAEAQAASIVTVEDYNKWKIYKDKFLAEREKEGLDLFNHKDDKDPSKNGICTSTHLAWKSACSLRDRVVGRYTEARSILAPKLGVWWNAEQERLRQEQIKAEESARTAEAERLKAEGAGKVEVRKVLDGRTEIPLPVVAQAPKTVGRKPVDYWSATVTDLMVLAKAVVSGKIPVGALVGIEEIKAVTPKTYESSYLDKEAGRLKDADMFSKMYPGCRAKKGTR